MATKKTSKFHFQNWRESSFDSASNPGSAIEPVYAGKYDDDGVLTIEKVGEVNVFDRIQSFKEICDINNIMKRYEAGDVSVLQRAQGIYMDATAVPENLADLMNKLNHAQDEFEKLPIEFKQKYGNDFVRYIMQVDPIDFIQKVEKVPDIEDKEIAKTKKVTENVEE